MSSQVRTATSFQSFTGTTFQTIGDDVPSGTNLWALNKSNGTVAWYAGVPDPVYPNFNSMLGFGVVGPQGIYLQSNVSPSVIRASLTDGAVLNSFTQTSMRNMWAAHADNAYLYVYVGGLRRNFDDMAIAPYADPPLVEQRGWNDDRQTYYNGYIWNQTGGAITSAQIASWNLADGKVEVAYTRTATDWPYGAGNESPSLRATTGVFHNETLYTAGVAKTTFPTTKYYQSIAKWADPDIFADPFNGDANGDIRYAKAGEYVYFCGYQTPASSPNVWAYDGDLNLVWSAQVCGDYPIRALSMEADDNGVYVGAYPANPQTAGVPYPDVDADKCMITHIDNNGNPVWGFNAYRTIDGDKNYIARLRIIGQDATRIFVVHVTGTEDEWETLNLT